MKNQNVESLKYFLGVRVEPPVVPVLYRFRDGSEPVLGWYRFIWSKIVPGTGLFLFLLFYFENCRNRLLIGS